MPNNNHPKLCPQCGGEVILKEGISSRTGKKYSFWGCANFIEKGCRYIYSPPKTGQTTGTDKIIEELDQGELILGEIKKINERIDKLGDYLKKKLGE